MFALKLSGIQKKFQTKKTKAIYCFYYLSQKDLKSSKGES